MIVETIAVAGRRQDARQDGLGAGAEQRTELGGAINIEQDELAAVRRQMGIEGRK